MSYFASSSSYSNTFLVAAFTTSQKTLAQVLMCKSQTAVDMAQFFGQ